MTAVEATGGSETVAAASLAGAGLPVVVVDPAQVRAFADALGRRARTDPIAAARTLPTILDAVLRDREPWTKEQAHVEVSI